MGEIWANIEVEPLLFETVNAGCVCACCCVRAGHILPWVFLRVVAFGSVLFLQPCISIEQRMFMLSIEQPMFMLAKHMHLLT